MRYNLSFRKVMAIVGPASIVAGAIYILYQSLSYMMGPGGGDGFLLASALSLVFVFTGNRAVRGKNRYMVGTN